jgi:hypothetical protein
MAYLVGNRGGGWGAASAGAWSAGAQCGAGLRADFVELHLLSPRRPPVRPLCDPLHHRFDTPFAALVKQGSSSGAGDLHGLRYAAQVDGPEGMQDAALGGHHGTHVPRARFARRARAAGTSVGAGASSAASGSIQAECTRHVARQRQEVEPLHGSSCG